MKAVYYEKPGGLEVIKYGNWQTPRPKNEALVRMKACGLNRLDIWIRDRYGPNIVFPHIPGSDVSGIVEEVNGKSSFKKGQAVVINPAFPCNICSRCLKGLSCERVRIFGYNTQGGYAEYVVVPIDQLYPKPNNLTFIEVAAFPLTFLTAWHMLAGRAALKKGETVFIWGASGGLGLAGVKIAKYLGARVIAACSSDQDGRQIKKITKADYVINYKKENVVKAVKEITDGLGVDVVFESVGVSTWNTSLEILRPLGRVVIAGTTSGEIAKLNLSNVYYNQFSILGSRMGTKDEFEKVLVFVSKGLLAPFIDKVYPLKEAALAQKRMQESKHIGKIVLKVE
ncbi:zinc-binding dehydrogenase [Candidatus Roizmanbacteria bacterium]|nr:zinc-binding dehydrogenase [Candidatus Roizmanbacteria bacterium]